RMVEFSNIKIHGLQASGLNELRLQALDRRVHFNAFILNPVELWTRTLSDIQEMENTLLSGFHSEVVSKNDYLIRKADIYKTSGLKIDGLRVQSLNILNSVMKEHHKSAKRKALPYPAYRNCFLLPAEMGIRADDLWKYAENAIDELGID